MSTLAEASHMTARERSFIGKPARISSGAPLTRVRRVAHRSDILLDDQISLVKETQDALEKAMAMMSVARDPREQAGWLQEVERLKLQCDEMLLILKVVRKLSVELLYAKVEVEKAAQCHGNVGAARKRVVWLEDRMEQLLSRYRNEFRLNSPLPIQPRFVTEKKSRPGAGRAGTNQTKQSVDSSRPKSILKVPGRRMVVDDEEGNEGEERSGGSGMRSRERGGQTRPNARRERQPVARVQRADLRGLETDETQSTGDESGKGDGEWVAKQRLALRSRGRPGGAGERGARQQPVKGGEGGGGGRGVNGARGQRARVLNSGLDTEDEDTDASVERRHHSRRERKRRPGGAGERISRERSVVMAMGGGESESAVDSSEDTRTRKKQPNRLAVQRQSRGRGGKAGGATETEDDDGEEEEEEGELSARSDLEDAEFGGVADGVFMTQESAQSEDESTPETFSESPASKGGQGAQGDDEEEDDEEEDEATKYWKSPHHKFEYSEHREAISRENPMSYHNLGLAVCSTFIEPAPEMAPELPWRPMKEGEKISDVHVAKIHPLRPVTAKGEELVSWLTLLEHCPSN